MSKASIFIYVLSFTISNNIYNICLGQEVNLAKDTVIRNKLVRLNLNQFEGKNVEDFLKNDTVKLFQDYFWSDEPPGRIHSLNLIYARGLYLKIFVDTLKYQPRFSERRDFSFDKFRSEKIHEVKLDRDFFEKNVVKKNSQ